GRAARRDEFARIGRQEPLEHETDGFGWIAGPPAGVVVGAVAEPPCGVHLEKAIRGLETRHGPPAGTGAAKRARPTILIVMDSDVSKSSGDAGHETRVHVPPSGKRSAARRLAASKEDSEGWESAGGAGGGGEAVLEFRWARR